MTTINDIAKKVGRSITTVSKALAGYEDVSPTTRELVWKAAEEMGYIPNSAAQQLKKRQSNTLGLILPTSSPRFSDPFFSEFIAGIGNKAALFDFDVLVSTRAPGESELLDYKKKVQSRRVDGFIIVRTRRQDPRINYLREVGFPFVSFGCTEEPLDFHFVDEDSGYGMRLAVNHLYDLGHRQIACIYPPKNLNFSLDRLSSVRSQMEKLGLALREEWFIQGDLTQESGYEAANRLLSLPESPSAIICCNDLMAFGAMSAIQNRGLVVGKDISVTGFDNIPMSTHSHPPLTTLTQPIYQIGGLVCEMLIKIIRGQPVDQQQIYLKPELIVRQSTGAAPERTPGAPMGTPPDAAGEKRHIFEARLLSLLSQLYPNSAGAVAAGLIERLEAANPFQAGCDPSESPAALAKNRSLEHETILITYGNSIRKENEAGLVTLERFLKAYVGNVISTVHLLPFFPYSSDDGFSVIDYASIDPQIGAWGDVGRFSCAYRLMFDAVINHISRESQWFKRFLADQAPEKDYFIEADPAEDTSLVVRPRALPLLTKVKTASAEKYVWTTFSSDQIDLNYQNPELLKEMLALLVAYARSGASLIRLDAIAYCWKKKHSSCISLPETHALVKLIRLCLDEYAPGTRIITETNVPHLENISYFGAGDEANLVYQFALPPLTLFSFRSGNAEKLTRWLMNLEEPPLGGCYFNFLSSHDGIGLMPIEGILDESEKRFLERCTLESGGRISYKRLGDGTQRAYELNINYQDALASVNESDAYRIERFLAAETLLVSLKGVPGIYIHSLLGSRNNYSEMTVSGIARRINRGSLAYDQLVEELGADSPRRMIFDELIRRLKLRSEHAALRVDSAQKVLALDPRLVSFERRSSQPGREETILVLVNVSDEPVALRLEKPGLDLISNQWKEASLQVPARSSLWLLQDGMEHR
ncbi:MAG: substrate-binding domain-containing protein [Anaerolineales bacterium]|jgi:sucrose phosphorylase|nr:substrate-binding domain-containing protein [Anaerolineales bacterium]